MVNIINKLKQSAFLSETFIRLEDSQMFLQTSNERCVNGIFKFGFSLAEVLIAMLIMSIFFMATAKVMSTKQKPLIQESRHGFYECYSSSGGLKEHREDSGNITISPDTSVESCEFIPMQGVPLFNVYIVHPNFGVYSRSETIINAEDNMRFSGPLGLKDIYSELETDPDRTINVIMAENIDNKFAQLKNYLQTSLPRSVLGSNWNEAAPPFPAVLIVW